MAADHPLVERFGLLLSKAVRVAGSPSLEMWVIPGTRGAALRFRLHGRGGIGGVSGPVESVALRGLCAWTEALDGLHQTLYGLVPDGNDFVTVNLEDGETATVLVVENLYSFASAARMRSVQFIDAAGESDLRSLQHP